MSHTQFNIEQAIQRSFNIKKPSHPSCQSLGEMEISGFAVASQEAHSLNDILKAEGHLDDVSPYYFAPNGKWSVINLPKIKIQWAARCRQVQVQDQDDNGCIWNVVSGHWNDKIFIPDVLSPGVRVEIEPLEPPVSLDSKNILLPYTIYRSSEDISSLVPQVRFGSCLLECIRPLSLETVSINRQGIYINRKFRDKVELCDPKDLDTDMVCIDKFTLRIFYGKQLLSSTTYLGTIT